MKIAIVTDVWHPQENTVVTTFDYVARELEQMGHEILCITPDDFSTVPFPGHPSGRFPIFPGSRLVNKIDPFAPDAIHVATEGILGLSTRKYCADRTIPFTSSTHLNRPELIRMHTSIPVNWSRRYLRWFHHGAQHTLVATSLEKFSLAQLGFKNLEVWMAGVDTSLFRPRDKSILDAQRPVFIHAGEVNVEKNVEAFLRLDLPGCKIVVGDGPDLAMLRYKYPRTIFTGRKSGPELASCLAAADVFIYPGLEVYPDSLLLEAMACGVPVAAFPIAGLKELVKNGVNGVLNDNLYRASKGALDLNPLDCTDFAAHHTWRRSSEKFLEHLVTIENNCGKFRSGQILIDV